MEFQQGEKDERDIATSLSGFFFFFFLVFFCCLPAHLVTKSYLLLLVPSSTSLTIGISHRLRDADMVASQVTADDETVVADEDADAGGEGRGCKTMTPSDWGGSTSSRAVATRLCMQTKQTRSSG